MSKTLCYFFHQQIQLNTSDHKAWLAYFYQHIRNVELLLLHILVKWKIQVLFIQTIYMAIHLRKQLQTVCKILKTMINKFLKHTFWLATTSFPRKVHLTPDPKTLGESKFVMLSKRPARFGPIKYWDGGNHFRGQATTEKACFLSQTGCN